jgi:hypothetical protein
MDLANFLRQTQSEVQARGAATAASGDEAFCDTVMQHMAEIGMTGDPVSLPYSSRVGNSTLRLSGYALSDGADKLDLFVSLYGGESEVTPIPDSATRTASDQCLRFLARCVARRFPDDAGARDAVRAFAQLIPDIFPSLEQIRIYVLTDRKARSRSLPGRTIAGREVRVEVMDIERLHRHWSEGKPRDELVVNIEEIAGAPVPCVYVPGEGEEYDCALAAVPAEVLCFVYERWGARLLEANVRSFLGAAGKVNRGVRSTLRDHPERFLAYNNGIVIVADEIRMSRCADGTPGISRLRGMQIVNGGQTTASLYFTRKRFPDTDLRRVRVPAKIIVLHSCSEELEEHLIEEISRSANSQNVVKLSDLSANRAFHVQIEKLALTTYCPDGSGRWFYERAAGSYNVMLSREGTTPAKLRRLRESIPTTRKITKTDLAKYLNAWDRLPHIVSRGAQKNFEAFTERRASPTVASLPLPGVPEFKGMIACSLLFQATQRIARQQFQAFQANVAAYTVALVSDRLGSRLDLESIWNRQSVSDPLAKQVSRWAAEVNTVLHRSAGERMISEIAKLEPCWDAVRNARYSAPAAGIPELRG